MPSKRILVVDDDPAIVLLIATILKREHYAVDTAGGGQEALSMIERTLYDVIVLDLMMPEVSGLDLLRALHLHVPQVKCVVIVSAGLEFDLATSTHQNVFRAIAKPFDIRELVAAVQECTEANCPPAPAIPLPPAAFADRRGLPALHPPEE